MLELEDWGKPKEKGKEKGRETWVRGVSLWRREERGEGEEKHVEAWKTAQDQQQQNTFLTIPLLLLFSLLDFLPAGTSPFSRNLTKAPYSILSSPSSLSTASPRSHRARMSGRREGEGRERKEEREERVR